MRVSANSKLLIERHVQLVLENLHQQKNCTPMRRQPHTKGWKEWDWGLTRQFFGLKLLSKLFTEMVAITREEVVAIARPFLHEFLDDLIYLRACTVGLSQRNGLSVRVHRIIHWRTAEDSAPSLTESEWPFLSVNLSADHFWTSVNNLVTII